MSVWCGPRPAGVWCCTLAIVYVVCQMAQVGDAQAYHFSKGWMPGRKRSSDAQLVGDPGRAGALALDSVYGESGHGSAAQLCATKSQTYQLAVEILKVRFFSLSSSTSVCVCLSVCLSVYLSVYWAHG